MRHAVRIGTAVGCGVGAASGLLAYVSGFLDGLGIFDVAIRWVWLVFLGGFAVGVSSYFLRDASALRKAEGPWRIRWRNLQVLLPASGLSVTIFGVALSFACGPESCGSRPYRLDGLLLVAVGAILFLAGLVLSASAPRPSRPRK